MLLALFISIFSLSAHADKLDKYLESADYLKDTACYTHYMVKEVDNALAGRKLRKGYESYQLLSKPKLYVEKSKAQRTIKYKASTYESKTGKKLNLKTCMPYDKLVAKGKRLELQELFLMEFMSSFGR